MSIYRHLQRWRYLFLHYFFFTIWSNQRESVIIRDKDCQNVPGLKRYGTETAAFLNDNCQMSKERKEKYE